MVTTLVIHMDHYSFTDPGGMEGWVGLVTSPNAEHAQPLDVSSYVVLLDKRDMRAACSGSYSATQGGWESNPAPLDGESNYCAVKRGRLLRPLGSRSCNALCAIEKKRSSLRRPFPPTYMHVFAEMWESPAAKGCLQIMTNCRSWSCVSMTSVAKTTLLEH